ncbi:hypothetical protein PIB30_087401 [Stylosanthes scabra]|uniref:Retrotransposon gag domain-containing protein n=1 Tax=Stylosanthes scabra TaxID=79078 RepID=A0ABU6QVU3_9FABA|nr:hypothetical protein [Stylosanthes scabra]
MVTTLSWYPEPSRSIPMALLFSSHLNHKNNLVPLANKLEENNFSTCLPSETDFKSSVKKGEAEADASVITKKTPSSTPKTLQESEKYTEWMQIDCALMTWLDASMSITYQNRVMHSATFVEAWETITHIFTASSSTRIQSVKTQLRATEKTGTINEYLQAI